MSDEILDSFREDPHLGVGDSAPWLSSATSNDIYRPSGWTFRSGETARICLALARIDPEISATPGAELLIEWFTALSDVTNAVKFYVKLFSFTPGGASAKLNPSSADFTAALDTSVSQVSQGANLLNVASVTIPNGLCVARNKLIGIIERNDSDVADTISGEVKIMDVLFQANKA